MRAPGKTRTWPNSCLISCILIFLTTMQALSRSSDRRSPRCLAASPDRRAWQVRLLMSLMLVVAGLLWLVAPVMAATPDDPACLSSPPACVEGTTLAAHLDAADADHGDLADVDVLCAEPPVMRVACAASRRDAPVALAVTAVQPWLPPPRRLG
jgi:hypothetical protein